MRAVHEVMQRDVYCLRCDTSLERAATELASRQIGGAPVLGPEGKLAGMLSMTDLVEVYGPSQGSRQVREVMTPELLAVAPEDPIERAIDLMAFEGIYRVLVLDRDGQLVGVLTAMDVLRELAGYPREQPRVIAVAPPA